MRRLLRLFVLVVGWVLFLLAWQLALQRVSDRALLVTAVVLLLAVAVNAAAAALMLLGRHDRITVPAVGSPLREDRLGRRLVVADDAACASVVVVGLDAATGAKRLRGAGRPRA